jgi:hypothetical protein
MNDEELTRLVHAIHARVRADPEGGAIFNGQPPDG